MDSAVTMAKRMLDNKQFLCRDEHSASLKCLTDSNGDKDSCAPFFAAYDTDRDGKLSSAQAEHDLDAIGRRVAVPHARRVRLLLGEPQALRRRHGRAPP